MSFFSPRLSQGGPSRTYTYVSSSGVRLYVEYYECVTSVVIQVGGVAEPVTEGLTQRVAETRPESITAR